MKRFRNVTKVLLVFLMVFGLLATNLSVFATDVDTATYKSTGEFELLKIDSATGKPIKGAKFVFSNNKELLEKYPNLTDKEKKSVINATTDDKGKIKLSLEVERNKDNTTWHYKEIEADDYVVSEEIISVKIYKNKTTKDIYKNTSLGKLKILKVDPNDTPLNGAEFKIVLLKDGKEVVIEENLVVNGEYTKDKLVPGTYRIYETKAPKGYALIPGYREVEVEPYTKSEFIVEVKFVNTPTGDLKINKYEINSTTKLEGAVFEIFTDPDLTVPVAGSPFTTDKNGEILLSLAPGTYYIKESKAPAGYILNTEVYTVTVRYSQTESLDVYNTPIPPTAGNYASTLLAGLILASSTALLYICYRVTKKRVTR